MLTSDTLAAFAALDTSEQVAVFRTASLPATVENAVLRHLEIRHPDRASALLTALDRAGA